MRYFTWMWISLFCCVSSIQAAVTNDEILIAARALSFLENPYSGKITVGIVYTEDNPISLHEAEQLQQLIARGLTLGDITLYPEMVKISHIEDAADVTLFYLTEGLGAKTDELLRISQRKKILCITKDIAQVKNGACVMGLRSKPKVEILVNTSAAQKSEKVFSTAFRLMITEI